MFFGQKWCFWQKIFRIPSAEGVNFFPYFFRKSSVRYGGGPITPKITIFRHVRNDQIWPPVPSSMHQTIQGDPRDGWDELKPDRSYLSHFPPWYSKSGHFPIEIPIKKRKWLVSFYGSIKFVFGLWPYHTYPHGLPKLRSKNPSLRKNGTP